MIVVDGIDSTFAQWIISLLMPSSRLHLLTDQAIVIFVGLGHYFIVSNLRQRWQVNIIIPYFQHIECVILDSHVSK